MPMQWTSARTLLVGDALSTFGSWIDFLAILTLAAYAYQVSPVQMAVISAAGLLPGILCAPYIGRLCDQGDPKKLLLASLLVRVLATAGIVCTGNYILFVALIGVRSVFSSFLFPAVNVLAVRAIAPEGRARFYSVLNVINSAAKIVAPMVGTISSALSGEVVALSFSIFLTGLSAVVFWRLDVRPASPGELAPASAAALAGESADAKPGMGLLLYVGTAYAFYVQMVNNLVPVVLSNAGFNKSLLGVLVGCAGAGNVLSGAWLARRNARPSGQVHLPELIVPAMVQGAGFGLMGLTIASPSSSSSVVLAGLFFAIGIFSTRFTVALSLFTSHRFAASMGRAVSSLQAWQNLMLLVAPLLGALILQTHGALALFSCAALFSFLAYGGLWAYGGRRA